MNGTMSTADGSVTSATVGGCHAGELAGAKRTRPHGRLLPSQRILAYADNDLAGCPSLHEHLKSIRRPLERKDSTYVRLQFSLLKRREQLGCVLPMKLGFTLCELSPENPEQRTAFEKRKIRRDGLDAAAGKPDDQDPASPCHGTQAVVEQVTADRIENDIGTPARCQFTDGIFQPAFRVVDNFVGAVRTSQLKFFGGAGSGDDSCSQQLADLHRCKSYAACGAEDKQSLAGDDCSALPERVPGGAVCKEERRGDLGIEVGRDGDH